jgi:hypothetical protein
MTAQRRTTKPAARKPAAGRKLPPLSVAHFEKALELVEALVNEETDVFVAAGQRYRERHRDGTERRLTAQEAAQIATAMADAAGLPPIAVAVAVQESDLRGYDEPDPKEMLMAAGAATAPAFMRAVKRFVALIEMPVDVLEQACESNTLDDAIDEAVQKMTYLPLAGPDGARERAQRAFDHFAVEAASSTGKALALLTRGWWQATQQAMTSMGYQSAPSSLTGSPPDTTGLAETSSTAPPTARP